MLPTFPEPLLFLHRSEYMRLEYHELLMACEAVEITVAKEWRLLLRKKREISLTLNIGINIGQVESEHQN